MNHQYVYILSENEPDYQLWTVGFYLTPDAAGWQPVSDHGNEAAAKDEVARLNGERKTTKAKAIKLGCQIGKEVFDIDVIPISMLGGTSDAMCVSISKCITRKFLGIPIGRTWVNFRISFTDADPKWLSELETDPDA